MSTSRRRLGDHGEDIATAYLTQKGYVVADRHWQTRIGELDIVAWAPKERWWQRKRRLIFFEVKTRATATFGYPEEAITKEKREKIRRTAEQYIFEYHLYDTPYQIDALAIELFGDAPPRITHFEHITE